MRPGIAWATIVVIVPLLWLLARQVGRLADAATAPDSRRGFSVAELAVGMSAGSVLALIGSTTTTPAFWSVAAVACLATSAAFGVGNEIAPRFASVGYMVPSGRRVDPGTLGASTAAGGGSATIAMFLVAAAAQGLGLINPGAGGLIVLAVLVASLAGHWMAGRGLPRLAVAAATALIAASLATVAVYLLP